MKSVSTDAAPAAVGPYSQAMVLNDLVFCSGQIPLDPETGELVTESMESATRRVLANMDAVLTAAGSGRQQVVKITIYLVDLAEFTTVNTIYAEFFGDHRPARACVQVSALPKGARIEIEAIATCNE